LIECKVLLPDTAEVALKFLQATGTGGIVTVLRGHTEASLLSLLRGWIEADA